MVYVSDRGLVRTLFDEEDLSLRLKLLLGAMGRDPASREVGIVRDEIRSTVRAKTLLAEQGADGSIRLPVDEPFRGAHWVLYILAELGYGAGDQDLVGLREQVYEWLFAAERQEKIRTVKGQVHCPAAAEGYALYYLMVLGLADERTAQLAQRLVAWQRPDGGWGQQGKASFEDTVPPLRGLVQYAAASGDQQVRAAIEKAAEFVMERQLFQRQPGGQPGRKDYLKLHFPHYDRYDVLLGLKAMVEAGCVADERCGPALDLVEAKRLKDGGFPMEGCFFRLGREERGSLVNWGRSDSRKMHVLVTAEVLGVLQVAGRFS